MDPVPRRRLTWAAAIGLTAAALVSCTSEPAEPTCTAGAEASVLDLTYRSAPGVDPDLGSLDLHLPAFDATCRLAPLVVYVHGGGFQVGDKANAIADKVELFTGHGWAFASVNYRLTDPAEPAADQVRHPSHVEDVAAAIAWLQAEAATYRLDPHRVLLLGHSSGAFLVSLLGTDTALLSAAGVPPDDVRCVVSLDTEYDVAAQVAQGGSQEVLYRTAFGDDPATWAAGSPISHTLPDRDRPAFLVLTRGAARRRAASADFGAALRAGGTPAEVLDVRPLDHEGVNAAVGAPGEQVVTPAVVDHARSCFAAR